MITVRPSDARGHFDFGWLDTRHSFSFGEYYDPDHDQFRALRVINEDWVQAGQGFGTHGHKDMEILTWVLSGSLEHQDSMGNRGIIRPGEAQRMSAGTGVRHSEFNASTKEPVHLLQIWLLPEAQNLEPSYEQKHFPEAQRRDRLCLIVSPDAREGSLSWHQDAQLHTGLLGAGKAVELPLRSQRHAWIQIAKGIVMLNHTNKLGQGDGAALSDESLLNIQALEESEVLVFDLA